ncbi:alpha/beta fold hydrolase [Serratia ficaria]|uniref:alpha/beta fold hydrolase n=1 Tax=Serratia ficaria TaxID=61651 RepID=UPI0021797D1C|nr:alpha/beta hydrolase [Serratia ficaria]CAI0796998.1 3-oxoadipate enol-lactonase 2 [Serratia ficaria]CAI1662386.1 3-oxoadipate enol-lactonase 2 [Serratia ficaria]
MLHRFQHQGLNFRYYDNQVQGPVLVFQHGLTGDHGQTRSTFTDEQYRLITLECRGHGGSDLGPVAELNISTFTDDVIALLDHLNLKTVAMAGISLGAAMSAAAAARYPERVKSVTLVRPAFHAMRMPDSQQVHSVVANYIDLYGADYGLACFEQTEIYACLAAKSPDNLNSLIQMFSMDPARVVPLLQRMTTCDPCFDAQALRQSGIPFRVIGTLYDEIHPLSKAEAICDDLGIAAVDIVYPKTLDRARYVRDVTDVIRSNIF